MKKNIKYILFAALVFFIISIFIIIDNNLSKSKIDEQTIDNTKGGDNNMNEYTSKINININETNYTAILEDNDTTREFLKRLPLEIDMNELNGNEKYYYFDDSLPSNPSRVGNIKSGDLMLYGSDCLVLFYESFNTSYSYTRIGKIDNPDNLRNNVGKTSVKISFTK